MNTPRQDFALTESEACDFLNVSRVTLWKLRKAGEIPTVISGGKKLLFLREDLEAYLRRNRVVVEPETAGTTA